MKFQVGDKFVLQGIECEIALIDRYGDAYLVPDEDGQEYHGSPVYIGCVFAIIDEKGKDKYGKKARSVSSNECGAV